MKTGWMQFWFSGFAISLIQLFELFLVYFMMEILGRDS